MSGPVTSVVVPNRNGARVLDRCLRHLHAQDHQSFEIIVVDDASTDESLTVASRHLDGERLTIVRSGRHRGLGAARNLGLRHARGRHVAYIDADGFAAPDWLRKGVTRLEEDPSLGAVASLVFFEGNRTVLNGAGGTMNRYGYTIDIGFNEPLEYAALPTEVVYPMGCGLIARRDALERVGGFDPHFTNYYDDAELGLKLWRAGYRIELARDAWIDHVYGYGGGSPHKWLLCERHRIRTVIKHHPLRWLPMWLLREAASVAGYPSVERARRRSAWSWNLPRLPSGVLARARSRPGRGQRPPYDSETRSYVPCMELSRPNPEQAQTRLRLDGTADAGALVYGFHEPQVHEGHRFRWMTTHGALLMRARHDTRRLTVQYMASWPAMEFAVEIRPLDDPEFLWRSGWSASRQPLSWARAELPARIRAGVYVIALSVSRTVKAFDGPRLGLGLTSVELA